MYELLHDALAEFLGGIGVALTALATIWAYRKVKAAAPTARLGDPVTTPEPPPPAERPGGHGTR
ncbi:hypothetical protein ACFCZV_24620 [Streptomyces hydrogenans]|uniref:hypothetical protein n=1 Tax=Streptomyces hydrogenans TaxID=1873719 RepID=UPI0035DD4FE1